MTIAGPEIIQGDFAAELTDLVDAAAGGHEIGEEHGFGDFRLDEIRRDAGPVGFRADYARRVRE